MPRFINAEILILLQNSVRFMEYPEAAITSGLNEMGRKIGTKKTQDILDACVADIHAHHPMMGYRSIRDTLILEHGWVLSDPTVLKSMQRLNIKGYFHRPKYSKYETGLLHSRFPNILRRNFKAEAPLQKVVTDVTYIKHKGKWHYLCAYPDLYNNEILEWELSDKFDNLLVMRPAERLLKRTESTTPPILFHSDQGVQYSSAGYCNLLKTYNAIQSMSRAGTPRDNAVMESFWRRFKDTLRIHFRYQVKDVLKNVVSQCVYYFNNIRPVRKLNGKPPTLFRTESVV